MATKFFDTVGFDAISINNASVGFGHKSALDKAGMTYNAWTFSTASVCRDTSQATNAANTKIILDTFLSDLNNRGIFIKS